MSLGRKPYFNEYLVHCFVLGRATWRLVGSLEMKFTEHYSILHNRNREMKPD
jgi:hypothetical protein